MPEKNLRGLGQSAPITENSVADTTMKDMNTITIILTSSVVSALISSLINSFFSFRLKNLDYKYTYYKEILSKRLNAYQFLETQVAVLKAIVLDEEDGRTYHMVFNQSYDDFVEFQKNLYLAMSYSLWINEKTVHSMQQLNDLFLHLNTELESGNDLQETGKIYYKQLSRARKELEISVRKDLLELHKLDKFLNEKSEYYVRQIKSYKPETEN